MKKICSILITVLLTLSSMTAFAKDTAASEPLSTDTPESSSELASGGVTLSIDDEHKYEGMDKAYKDGYVPIVEDDKAIITLPLIASGELDGYTISAIPQLGDPSASPFVFKNYQITVKQKDNPVGDGASAVSSYLVCFNLPLVSDRTNGVYQVAIDIKGKAADGSEVIQSFTTYVTITDGKVPESDSSEEVPEDIPEDVSDTGSGSTADNEEKPASQPKVIVSNYEINPSPVIAGKEFTVKVTLKNTSEKEAVQNMTVNISCESLNLTLLNDSSTVFIGRMDKGAVMELELKYITDLETPAIKYNISLAISYDNTEATSLVSSGVVPVTVQQDLNVKMEPPQIAAQVNSGDTMPLSIQVMNLGRSQVYNVRVELLAPGLIASGTAFIGNMEAGTALEGEMDVFVGTLDMSEGYESEDKYGVTNGVLTLIYEDADGQEYRDSIDISTTISEPVITAVDTEPDEEAQTVSQWWISIFIGAVLVGGFAVFLFIRRKNEVN